MLPKRAKKSQKEPKRAINEYQSYYCNFIIPIHIILS